jgi:hypothetical protein
MFVFIIDLKVAFLRPFHPDEPSCLQDALFQALTKLAHLWPKRNFARWPMPGKRFEPPCHAPGRGMAPAFSNFVMMLRPVVPAQVIFLASGPDNLVTWRGESRDFSLFCCA